MTATAFASTIQGFEEDPDTARTQPTVTAVLANGHARISAGPFNWDSDLPAAVGGTNLAPSPTAYLLGALAGCSVAFLHDTLAPQFGVEITQLSATARCTADLAGLLGVAGHDPALAGIRLEVALESSSDPERVERMKRAWAERCPIFLGLVNSQDVEVTYV